MSRGNAAANTTESQLAHTRPIVFVEARFDSGTMYLHNGVGNIEWGDDGASPAVALTWVGAGAILSVSEIGDSDEKGPINVSFRLNAVDADLLAAAESESIFERVIIVYCGYLDDAGNLVADPDERWRGFMDTTTIELGGELDAITLNAETELIRDARTNGALLTDEDQQDRYSGDTGFEFLDQLQDAIVQWGPDSNPVVPGTSAGSSTRTTTGRPDPNSRYYNQ